jgi:hypothetical protein
LRLVVERDARAVAARQPTDAELVSALRADDPGAPAMLWARRSPAVGRLLAKALGPCLEIEDLTQEVFLRVFARLPVASPLARSEIVLRAGQTLRVSLRDRTWPKRPTARTSRTLSGGR